jgi:putative PIN family toxin of toxin-antitoxin system
MKVVVDTNVLVSALSTKSIHHWVVKQILDEKFDLHIADEIMLEYEEILTQKYSATVANNFIAALKQLPNVYYTQVYFHWNLLNDKDDNKFVDCYVAANADYLVTQDKDFNSLRLISFPKVNIITMEEFKEIAEK